MAVRDVAPELGARRAVMASRQYRANADASVLRCSIRAVAGKLSVR